MQNSNRRTNFSPSRLPITVSRVQYLQSFPDSRINPRLYAMGARAQSYYSAKRISKLALLWPWIRFTIFAKLRFASNRPGRWSVVAIAARLSLSSLQRRSGNARSIRKLVRETISRKIVYRKIIVLVMK